MRNISEWQNETQVFNTIFNPCARCERVCGECHEQHYGKPALNIRYEYFQSLDDPETILLIDAWESQAAIDVHHASPMMKTIAKLRDKYDLKMTVERYTPDNTMPKTDEKFIRK